jgi:MarC family membrane protein
MSFVSAVVTLFLVMDPLGNVPIFLSVLKQVRPERRRKVVTREVLIAYGVLLGFLFAGDHALRLLQIEQESISIAGGIVLFLIAIRMIFPHRTEHVENTDGEPLVVPLAIPLVAGPSTLATLLLLQRAENSSTLSHPACGAVLLSNPGQARPGGDGAPDGHGARDDCRADAAQWHRRVLASGGIGTDRESRHATRVPQRTHQGAATRTSSLPT